MGDFVTYHVRVIGRDSKQFGKEHPLEVRVVQRLAVTVDGGDVRHVAEDIMLAAGDENREWLSTRSRPVAMSAISTARAS